MTDKRYFYIEAHTPRGIVYCGKVYETEPLIRAVFQGCTIDPTGVVRVHRGPNDTWLSLGASRWIPETMMARRRNISERTGEVV